MNATARLIGICLVLISGTVAGVVAVRAPVESAPAAPAKCTGVMVPGASC